LRSQATIAIGAARTGTRGANQATTVGADRSLNVRCAQNTSTPSIAEDGSLTGSKNLKIMASNTIAITTGDASFTMKKDGTIQIKGKGSNIDGKGKIDVKASSAKTLKR
jgi:type VI secretion system secreted protein VgrG